MVRSLWMAGRACQGPSLPSRRPGFTVHGGPPRSPEHRGRRRRLFPLPVPSRPVPSLPRARRSPAPPACLSLRSKKKKTKNEKTLLEGPRDRSIDQHSRRCGARGGSSGGKSRHGVVQAQPVRAGVARSLQGKVAAPSPPRSPSASPPALPGDSPRPPCSHNSVYTLTDATERSIIGVVVVVVVLQTGALLTYLFCEFFSDNFVVNFVVLSLFLACDFWTVSDSNLQPLSLFLSLRSKPSDEFC